jgi:hypothetical protein
MIFLFHLGPPVYLCVVSLHIDRHTSDSGSLLRLGKRNCFFRYDYILRKQALAKEEISSFSEFSSSTLLSLSHSKESRERRVGSIVRRWVMTFKHPTLFFGGEEFSFR